jgi:hypothetical protein
MPVVVTIRQVLPAGVVGVFAGLDDSEQPQRLAATTVTEKIRNCRNVFTPDRYGFRKSKF